MTADKIRVMIVDDHMVVRRGLSHVIKTLKDVELVAEAEGGEEALHWCRLHQPDVILMDVKMDGMDGVAATEAICKFYPHVRVIALSSFHEKEMVEQMMNAGAIGYLLKNVSVKELAYAIRSAAVGTSTLAPEVAQAMKISCATPAANAQNSGLTERQTEVLALMAAGLSNGEIARNLTISLSTARFHVSGILTKLGVSNRTEAVAIAIKQGLVAD